MDIELEQQAAQLFDDALAQSASLRLEFVRGRCGSNMKLRDRVELLLRHYNASTGFLESPGGAVEDGCASLVGASIAGYKVERLLGAGGMSRVYLARQENPGRYVAVKVVRPEFVAPGAVRRFHYEAQLLARLQHPGIAQIFEAGTSQVDGRRVPFFAMEYIEGLPITEYVQKYELEVDHRVRLICQVCDAVQHAHVKGVIHRDLKPANIMVRDDQALHAAMSDNGAPVTPKVLDFGVARVSGTAQGTLHTHVGQIIGTLGYMSPEQLAGDPEQVDTRSDVYALGVVAFELLAGRLPYDIKGKTLPETIRIISEQEPLRLDAVDQGLNKDLPAIVNKALDKDRDRRYDSATALADDLRRYLRAEPVRARPPTKTYLLKKFAQRHRAAVIGGTAAVIALVAGMVVTLIALMQVLYANERTRTEAARKERALKFLDEMLTSPNPDIGAVDLLVADMLDTAAARIDGNTEDAQTQAAIYDTLGRAYAALGRYPQAEEQLRNALQARLNLHGPRNLETAQTQAALAGVLVHNGALEQAEQLAREVLATRRDFLGEKHKAVATALHDLADVVFDRAAWDTAEQLYDDALALRTALCGHESLQVAETLAGLAKLHRWRGDARAESEYRQALEIRQQLLGDNHPLVAASMTGFGRFLSTVNRDLAQAERYLTGAQEIDLELRGPDHPDTADNLITYAVLLRRQGDYAGAESACREAVARCTRVLGPDHRRTLDAKLELGYFQYAHGDPGESDSLLQEVLAGRRALLGDAHPDVISTLSVLGRLRRKQDRFEDAELILKQMLELSEQVYGPVAPQVASGLVTLAELLRNDRRALEAEPLLRRALDIRRELYGPDHPWTGRSMFRLARCLDQLGRYDETESVYREAAQIVLSGYPPNQELAEYLMEAGHVLHQRDRIAEVEPFFRKALEIRREVLDPDDVDIANTANALGQTLVQLCRYDEAEPLLEEALAGRRQVYGDEHRLIASPLRGLANVYAVQGDFNEAVQTARQSLAISYATRGSNHRYTAEMESELAEWLIELGEYKEADLLLTGALRTLEGTLGRDARSTQLTQQRIALLRDQYPSPSHTNDPSP